MLVARIATGEIEEAPIAPRGATGGRARAEALSPSKRSVIASLAAKRRWQGTEEDDDMQTANNETGARGRQAVCMYPNNSLREPVRPYENLVAELVKSSFTK